MLWTEALVSERQVGKRGGVLDGKRAELNAGFKQ